MPPNVLLPAAHYDPLHSGDERVRLVCIQTAPAARVFRADLADGLFNVEWNRGSDLQRAVEFDEHYADLSLGLVDTVVMAVAERLGAQAIATLDLRDFASVELAGRPALWPRDL